jgi:hypothetical protein
LLDAGVPLLAGPAEEPIWQNLPPAVQTTLEARGLLDGDTALWTYQANFAWDQAFEPGETRVEISYAPVFEYQGEARSVADKASAATQAYCIDDALRRASALIPAADLYTVTHLNAPAGRWRGPVGQYRLVVDKQAVADLVAFCPLAAKKIAPTTFEWTAKNFTLGSQTSVLYASAPDAAAEQ